MKAPFASLVPATEPGLTVTAWLETAPLPSTRRRLPLRSARLIVIAASALAEAMLNVAATASATTGRRRRAMVRPSSGGTPRNAHGWAGFPLDVGRRTAALVAGSVRERSRHERELLAMRWLTRAMTDDRAGQLDHIEA